MGDASTLNAKSGTLASASYFFVDRHPCYRGLKKQESPARFRRNLDFIGARPHDLSLVFAEPVTCDLQDDGSVRAQIGGNPEGLRSRSRIMRALGCFRPLPELHRLRAAGIMLSSRAESAAINGA